MTTTSQISSSPEQGARPAIPTQVAVDKLATECKCKNQIKSIPNVSLMKASRVLRVATFNVRTLKNENIISEIIASANATQLDIICLQEHRFIHEDVDTNEYSIGECHMITGSAWKNRVNAATGGIGILINKTSFNSLVNVTLVSKRIMIVNFNGNPQTSIIVCSPTNVSDPMETNSKT